MKINDSNTRKIFENAIKRYFDGQISRKQLAENARSLCQKIDKSDSNLRALVELALNWSVRQPTTEFIEVRGRILDFYQTLASNDEDKLESTVGEYIRNENFPKTKPTEDDVKILIKKVLKLYFDDEISENFLHEVVFEIMHKFPKATYYDYNFKDKVLLGILITIDDWNVSYSDENDYIEDQLLEYFENGTGPEALDSKKYYEKYIKDKKKNPY